MKKWAIGLVVGLAGVQLSLTLSRLGAQGNPFSLQVNFEPATSAVPASYIADTGAAYSTSRGYGWVSQDSLSTSTHTPIDISPNSRDRNLAWLDPRLGTLLHMQYPPDYSNSTAVKTPAAWEYTLPNGTYSVNVSVGDQPFSLGYDSQHTINVEGVSAISQFQASDAQQYKQALVKATVSDGKLTIDAVDGFNTKINYLQVASWPGFTSVGWGYGKASPVPRLEADGGFVGGKLYVFGGYIDTTFYPTARSDVYDPTTDSWKQIANMPVPTTHAGTAIVGKYVYLAGGYYGNSSGGQTFATTNVWRYDTAANTWTSLPPLPAARGAGALAVLGRELHFFGGADINRSDKADHWLLRLDGGTSWTTAVALPNARNHLGAVVLGGKIYAVGGQHGQDNAAVAQNTVNIWDPALPNSWTTAVSLPTALSHILGSTFVLDNRLFVIGGQPNPSSAAATVLAFDPLGNNWTTLTPLPDGRYSGVAGSFNGQIFYATGSLTNTLYKGQVGQETAAAWLAAPTHTAAIQHRH
ncbi:Kelch repeat-containing protein [Gloeobacter kilaueensis]|uniref:N-acetylneuraminic acid mutarotase n=1 Tax=Gloeobacter kilaueensis (strain ATCC BAA-2537 / CCAP 1431/1 / ULC 316 / JS1) TaxID=1183438 RepID=U5QET9_GLOK1|nr:kelch repeat-containing protein [Gloeobacter kilaueensis]AGY57363.1 N-acetylneuraminic acid mutarotase [Gloeobacter kilaueensis JS1]